MAGDDSPDNAFFARGRWVQFAAVALFALLVRSAVSLHSYSGAGRPPMYGDFEAQRHWMEVTVNLPATSWYRNSTENPMGYWGLDYPPLTAYQSWLHGLLLRRLHPPSVELVSSRGHESSFGKLLMRWTVLSSDVLIFFPAALWFIIVYFRRRGKFDAAIWLFAVILINPALIIIDHGHFQYNCISLGFTLGAVAAILAKHDVVASFLFCLALNHKQMSAYFAPAFFAHLLGKCLQRKHPMIAVLKLGLVVVCTFAVIWWPYLHSLEAVLEVLSRLAPFERGIYEDYVASFWCATSIAIKWKKLYSTEVLRLFSLGATIFTLLPSVFQQVLAPSDQGFLYALLNSALSFYLFSFQVHEKSILLPLLPASLLALEEPFIFRWFMYYAMFSMFPLIRRDTLVVAYVALLALFVLVNNIPGLPRTKDIFKSVTRRWCMRLVFVGSLVLHILYLCMKPPEKYPFLFEAFIIMLSFFHFMLIASYTNVTQWMSSKFCNEKEKEKKIL